MSDTNLFFIIDRLEGKFAVLRSDDGLTINWPKKQLPKGAREGSALIIRVALEEDDRKQREKTAKEFLNEILNG